MFGLDEVRGGSGWGAGTFAGPTGQRQPSSTELGQAEHQVSAARLVSENLLCKNEQYVLCSMKATKLVVLLPICCVMNVCHLGLISGWHCLF